MARSYEFAILRVVPDARRGESVNIGLVVFGEGVTDVRLLASLSKVSAINAAVDLDQLRSLPQTISDWTGGVTTSAEKHRALQDLGIVTVTDLGTFEIGHAADYGHAVSRLMKSLVVPISAQEVLAPNPTRIAATLRAKFRANRILGSSPDDIRRHLVVPDYPVDENEGLYADFVVKNGAYHVTATADLRAPSTRKIDRVRAASLIAITLHKSKEKFGPKTKRFVVYASRKNAPAQAVNLIGDYSDAIFHLESKTDMASYMERIMQAASPTKAMHTHPTEN
jgi:hypothetical protein